MNTKLETLKLYLESEEIEKKVISDLILDYYNKQNATEYETDEGVYYVYNEREINDELLDIASERFSDLKSELKRLIRTGSPELSILIDEISEGDCIDLLRENMDYLCFEDKTFVMEDGSYFIYKEI